MRNYKEMTLCFIIKKAQDDLAIDHVCLALKKRGFRQGKLNGYGGKIEYGETAHEAAIRELHEESGILADSLNLNGTVTFCDHDATYLCYLFTLFNSVHEPIETEEMSPNWYPVTQVPYSKMGQADPYWLPHVLKGEKINAKFYFDKLNRMYKMELELESINQPKILCKNRIA